MTEPAPAARGPGDAYAAAGVDIEAADKAVELMKGWVDKARRPEVIGGARRLRRALRRLAR